MSERSFFSNLGIVGIALLTVTFSVVSPVEATPVTLRIVSSVVSVPQSPESGTPVTLRIMADGCSEWIPGWTAAVEGPEDGIITIDVSADLRPVICAGGQLRNRDIQLVAPPPGSYTIRVTGGGLYRDFSPPPIPYVFMPFTAPTPWIVTGGNPPVTAVPVSTVGPWGLGLLAGVVLVCGALTLLWRGRWLH
jgi:hypothetical protein